MERSTEVPSGTEPRASRRDFVKWALALGFSAPTLPAFLAGCRGEQGTPEASPTSTQPTVPEATATSPPPEGTLTATRQLEERPLGGIEGELVEATFGGETQEILRYIDINGDPFFALATYPTKGPGSTAVEEQFEEQHVYFPSSTNEGYAYLMLRKLPDGVSPEVLPFYDKADDRLHWIVDGQSQGEEDAFLKLNQGEKIEFDEEVGLYWTVDNQGKKKGFIEVYEPEPRIIDLSSEKARQLFEESGFCLKRPDGTTLEEVKEIAEGEALLPLKIGWNIGGEWIPRGHVLRAIPSKIKTNSYGGVLIPELNPEDPSVVYYKDKEGDLRGFLPLLFEVESRQADLIKEGYYPVIRALDGVGVETVLVNGQGDEVALSRGAYFPLSSVIASDTWEAHSARIDLLTRITGEPSVYNEAGGYINGERPEDQVQNILAETSGEKLAEVFLSLFEDGRFGVNGRLNEEGRKIARELIDVWRENLILFGPNSEEANQIANNLSFEIDSSSGLSTAEEAEIQKALEKVDELLGTAVEKHLQYIFLLTGLTKFEMAKTLRGVLSGRRGGGWSGAEEKYRTSYFDGLNMGVLFSLFFTEWRRTPEARAIINRACLIHEGANIYKGPGRGLQLSMPVLIEVLKTDQVLYPQHYDVLQGYIDILSNYDY